MENVYLFEIFLKSAPSLRALSQQEQTGNGEIEISDKIFRQNEVGYLFHFEIWDYQSRRIIRTKKIVKSLMETFPFMFSRKISSNDSCSIQVNFFTWKMYTYYLKQLNATETNAKSVNLKSDYKRDSTKKQSSEIHVKIYHAYLCKFWTFFL